MICDDARGAFLAGEPTAEQTNHLASCSACKSMADELETTRLALERDDVWEEPGPDLEDRVVTLIAGTAPAANATRPSGWWAAAAVIVGLLVTGGLWATQGGSSPDWEATLPGTIEAPNASGVVRGWNDAAGTRLRFDIVGLEDAPPGSVYQVWFSREATHVSAGTFAAAGEIEMWTGISRRDFPRIWITLELLDADESPSGYAVMDTG